jgi:hypothetical protein
VSEEQTYLDIPGCTVTSARIVIDGQTYATRNVGSVRVEELSTSKMAVAMALIGAAIAVSSLPAGAYGTTVIGVLLAAGGIKVARDSSGQRIMIMAGAGEAAALKSRDKALIAQIHAAIVQAISVR